MTTRDHVAYRHEAEPPLTVGALKKVLAHAPDDSTILLMSCDEPWTGNRSGWLARGVEVRPASGRGPHGDVSVVVTSGPPTGVMHRPRPGSLVVQHGPMPEESAERLRQAVHDVVAATGYRGQHSVGSPGSATTWEWESTDTVHVADVVAAAEAAAVTVNPGGSSISSRVG